MTQRRSSSRPAVVSRRPASLLALALVASVLPAAAHTSARDFADLSLEELMNETVTSVSKREQPLFDAASAVTVLTNDEIRRSGATNVADALRLVPGMVVASVNSHQWAISARGFNNVFANKLLVLVDGRAVYSPLFAGVYWDGVQPMLEDIDHIEVIRGPGATVWGANAVNGVINITTRDAKDTQGGLLFGSVGDIHEADVGMRYGDRLGDHTYYRIHAGGFSKSDYPLANGQSADDGWQGRHGGFRIDHHPAADTHLTWLAGATKIDTDDDTVDAHNLHTLARLTRSWSERSGAEFQVYYDQTQYDEDLRSFSRIDTLDLDAQHTFGVGERNDIIWGVGYRLAQIKAEQTTFDALVVNDRLRTHLFNVFVQDEFKLVPDKVTLTGGVKLEHNDYTGLEVQPSLRGVYKPTQHQTLWTAVSRAVRTPSALEGAETFSLVAGPPFPGPGGGLYVPRITGNTDLEAEIMWAYEVGYRIQPTHHVSVDLAAFYHDYSKLFVPGAIARFVPGVPVGSAEMPFSNGFEGTIRGGEVSMTVSPTNSWRVTASYSLQLTEFPRTSGNPYERGSPRHQVVLRSSHDFSKRLSVDAQVRYVDTIESVPSYITADLRLAYRITDELELSLVGQNLLDPQHPEQATFFLTRPSEVPRGFYGKVTWHF